MIPLVTCVVPIHDRDSWLPQLIESFNCQIYPNKNLLILPGFNKLSLGAKRNLTCELATGDIICHFDSDDWSAPTRISYQVSLLLSSTSDKQVTAFHTTTFRELREVKLLDDGKFRETSGWWKCTSAPGQIIGSSLCYFKSYWQNHPFPDVKGGEDDQFWETALNNSAAISYDGTDQMVCFNHTGSFSQRVVGGIHWSELPDLSHKFTAYKYFCQSFAQTV